jgi:hypothetical protein
MQSGWLVSSPLVVLISVLAIYPFIGTGSCDTLRVRSPALLLKTPTFRLCSPIVRTFLALTPRVRISCLVALDQVNSLTSLLVLLMPHLLRLLLVSLANYGCGHASALPEVVLSPTTEGSLGAVSSESIECSVIGRDLLARGVSLVAP